MLKENGICQFIECRENVWSKDGKYCKYHQQGGRFAGETYEQYEIIEQDFIDFIRCVPLNDPYHFKVHSPVLRDIIIRCCVQIEVFFKEWVKLSCSEDLHCLLWAKYGDPGKASKSKAEKSWKFSDYFFYKEELTIHKSVHVRELGEDIQPFDTWLDEKTPPKWWQAYNTIKHNGLQEKKEANLKNALFALSALFLMHCQNDRARWYLMQFNISPSASGFGKFSMNYKGISSPIDSKRYLFQESMARGKGYDAL